MAVTLAVSSRIFSTVNPFTEEEISSYSWEESNLLESKIQFSFSQYQAFRNSSTSDRVEWLKSLIPLLEERKKSWAGLASLEMGKPLQEALHEVEKCVGLCNYFIQNSEEFLAPEPIPYSKNAQITKSSVGIVLGIMPWNYPFWQAFRFAIPALMSGNSVILKHAPNVTGCALAMADCFNHSKFPSGLFQVAIADIEGTHQLLVDPRVQRISFTGSNETGNKVAMAAGSKGKKCVLELGGSDPFIVMEDAPLEKVIPFAIKSRFINAGQSCISAKRFLIHEKRYNDFVDLFQQEVKNLSMGNPLDATTQVGPLARKDLQQKVLNQIKDPQFFAKDLIYQSSVPDQGFFAPISVFGNVQVSSKVWKEEVFGPVAVINTFRNEGEMISLANDTNFGLGASIWSENVENALNLAQHIDAGNVYVNEMMKSDFALPFGGSKQSGFGKELSKWGMMEFLNLKTTISSTL